MSNRADGIKRCEPMNWIPKIPRTEQDHTTTLPYSPACTTFFSNKRGNYYTW